LRAGSKHSAKVLLTSLKGPFVTLCSCPRIPSTLAGVSGHLLLFDTTRELVEGGLELFDWRARTVGTAILLRLPEVSVV